MSHSGIFLDTNTLVYLRSGEAAKADAVEVLLRLRPIISVQVLNEFANISRKKLSRAWDEIAGALEHIKAICPVVPLTLAIHERGMALAAEHGFSVYDAMIVSAAESAGCGTLFSEDMQSGRRIGSVTIRNPFA